MKASDLEKWRVVKVAHQFYTFRDEEQAFQSPVLARVDVSVHEDIAGATEYAERLKQQFDEQALDEQESRQGGDLTQFEQLPGSNLGEDSLVVRYINANPGGPARHEEYRVVLRRSTVVARIELGAPEGYFDMRQLMLDLATAVDARLVTGDR